MSDKEKRAKLIEALLDEAGGEPKSDPAELARVRELVLLFRRLPVAVQLETLETLKRKLSH